MNNKFEILDINKEEDKKKVKVKVKASNEEKTNINEEFYSKWNNFRQYIVPLYSFKLHYMSNNELLIELFLLLDSMTRFFSYGFSNEGNENVLKHVTNNEGWITESVRDNEMITAKAQMMKHELKKRCFNELLLSMENINGEITERVGVIKQLLSNLIIAEKNMKVSMLTICNECRGSYKVLKETLSETILLLQIKKD